MGTKLKIAVDSKKLGNLGFDLVAMCANDILANGGEPIFFLDYISSSKINENDFLLILESINLACLEAGCSLVGGETAEMPGIYKPNEFDLAGFCVGVVERKNLLQKKNVQSDSVIIGLESNGFHSNGFSLIRKILEVNKIKLNSKTPYKSKKKLLEEDLLEPTKIYVNDILPLVKNNLISSIAHITGGGLYENLERIIPKGLRAKIDFKDFKIPEKFLWLSKLAKLDPREMLKTLNCGIGLILIISRNKLSKVKKYFSTQKIVYHEMGIVEFSRNKEKIIIEHYGKWDLT